MGIRVLMLALGLLLARSQTSFVQIHAACITSGSHSEGANTVPAVPNQHTLTHAHKDMKAQLERHTQCTGHTRASHTCARGNEEQETR